MTNFDITDLTTEFANDSKILFNDYSTDMKSEMYHCIDFLLTLTILKSLHSHVPLLILIQSAMLDHLVKPVMKEQ
jgi:hypothetical protein